MCDAAAAPLVRVAWAPEPENSYPYCTNYANYCVIKFLSIVRFVRLVDEPCMKSLLRRIGLAEVA